MLTRKKPITSAARYSSNGINHDGYIEQSEATADNKAVAVFGGADRNHDGKLCVPEFYRGDGSLIRRMPICVWDEYDKRRV